MSFSRWPPPPRGESGGFCTGKIAAAACYIQSMQLTLNGQTREFPDLTDSATVGDLITSLGLKGDRIAVEHNGDIVPRSEWAQAAVRPGDKFEIVHFVGGGSFSVSRCLLFL